jgi:hypothetical protein
VLYCLNLRLAVDWHSVVRSGRVILLLTVSQSVRLGLESLIVTHGHILAWKEISVLSFVWRPL